MESKRILKVSELFEKKAQVRVKFQGMSSREMLKRALGQAFTAVIRSAAPSGGEYTLNVAFHLVPDESKKRYDRAKSSADVFVTAGSADRHEELSKKMSVYNSRALGALLKYYEVADPLPNPLPPNHPGRRELDKSLDVMVISK